MLGRGGKTGGGQVERRGVYYFASSALARNCTIHRVFRPICVRMGMAIDHDVSHSLARTDAPIPPRLKLTGVHGGAEARRSRAAVTHPNPHHSEPQQRRLSQATPVVSLQSLERSAGPEFRFVALPHLPASSSSSPTPSLSTTPVRPISSPTDDISHAMRP